MIGSYALAFHAQARATKDLELIILPAPKVAQAVFKALQEFGAPLCPTAEPQNADRFARRRAITAEEFEDDHSWSMMGTPLVACDILAKI